MKVMKGSHLEREDGSVRLQVYAKLGTNRHLAAFALGHA